MIARFISSRFVTGLLVGLVVAVLTVLILTLVDRNTSMGIAAMMALILALVAFTIPVHTLPAAALVVYAVVPGKLLPDIALMSTIPLGTAILLIWRLRIALASAVGRKAHSLKDSSSIAARRDLVVTGIFAALFTIWVTLSALVHSSQAFGLGWMLSITVALFIGLTVRSAPREASLLMNTWIVVGSIAGVYAIVEFALGESPLFGALYALNDQVVAQHWSVYRAQVSFGHPLFAGSFFTAAAVLSIIRWLEKGGKLLLLAGLLSSAGMVATLSRGSMLATIIAIAAGVLVISLARGRRGIGRYTLLILVAGAAIMLVTSLDAFNERNNSLEASLSAGARDTGFMVAMQAAESSGFLGSGPATSGMTAAQFGEVVIENSYLQILISLGIPGLVLLTLFFGAVLVGGLRARRFAPTAALLGVLIALAGFNALDAVRSMHLVLGLAVFLALHAPAEAGVTDVRVDPRERRATTASRTSAYGREAPLTTGSEHSA